MKKRHTEQTNILINAIASAHSLTFAMVIRKHQNKQTNKQAEQQAATASVLSTKTNESRQEVDLRQDLNVTQTINHS